MKKIILPALAAVAALGLAACDGAETTPAATDDVAAADVGADGAMDATAATDGTMETTTDETADRVSISEDGVAADINDGDTSVSADIDGDPSMTVETN